MKLKKLLVTYIPNDLRGERIETVDLEKFGPVFPLFSSDPEKQPIIRYLLKDIVDIITSNPVVDNSIPVDTVSISGVTMTIDVSGEEYLYDVEIDPTVKLISSELLVVNGEEELFIDRTTGNYTVGEFISKHIYHPLNICYYEKAARYRTTIPRLVEELEGLAKNICWVKHNIATPIVKEKYLSLNKEQSNLFRKIFLHLDFGITEITEDWRFCSEVDPNGEMSLSCHGTGFNSTIIILSEMIKSLTEGKIIIMPYISKYGLHPLLERELLRVYCKLHKEMGSEGQLIFGSYNTTAENYKNTLMGI